MGIAHLAAFLYFKAEENVVSLEEIIKNNKKPDPIIVFEYLRLHNIFQGRYGTFEGQVQNFVTRLEKAGGKVVVWATDNDFISQEAVVRKQKRQSRSVSKQQADDSSSDDADLDGDVISSNIFCGEDLYFFSDRYVVYNAFKKRNVTLLQGSRHDLLRYISSINCVALVAQDSDFLIFNHIPRYLYLNEIDLETLKTVEFKRDDAKKLLNLNDAQLPMFAALIGGTSVDLAKLDKLHLQLKSLHGRSIVRAVAKFAVELCESSDFEVELRRYLDDDTIRTVSQAVRYYSETDFAVPSNSEMPIPFELSWDNLVMFYFIGHCKDNSIRIYRNPDAPSTEEYIPTTRFRNRPIRKRLYPLLFERRRRITEIYTYDPYSGSTFRFKAADLGSFTLQQIRNGPSSPELESTRWRLLCEGVSPNGWLEDAKTLPSSLVIPLSTLVYLMDPDGGSFMNDSLSETETRWLLAVILKISNNRNIVPISGALKKKISRRTFQVITLFLDCCHHVCLLNDACGHIVPSDDACPVRWFCIQYAIYLRSRKSLVDDILKKERNADLACRIIEKYTN